MIEKLDIKDYENKEQLVWVGVINKLNQLVDAVNGILDYAPLEMAMKAEPKTELERTRKALEIAVDALKEYADRDNWGMGFAPWLEDGFKDALYTEDGYKTAEKALEQIKALEQKDVK